MSESAVAHQFDDAEQQHEAAGLGMWGFLVTEVLFFGGLFAAYTIYRARYPEAFAEASHHLYMWIGAINMTVLLTSSFTMALAVHAAQTGKKRGTLKFMWMTVGLAAVFLGVKAVEYYLDYHDRIVPQVAFRTDWHSDPANVEMFFVLYFFMTGLHAFHVIVGIGVLGTLALLIWRSRRSMEHHVNAVEMSGLYWHFVDIIWIFLFPLLYLVSG